MDYYREPTKKEKQDLRKDIALILLFIGTTPGAFLVNKPIVDLIKSFKESDFMGDIITVFLIVGIAIIYLVLQTVPQYLASNAKVNFRIITFFATALLIVGIEAIFNATTAEDVVAGILSILAFTLVFIGAKWIKITKKDN